MYLSEIPGYIQAGKRADRLEDYWRDRAFLDLTETLRLPGGRSLELRQLTLRMFIELCAVRSPFMLGGAIGPEHVAQVLWRLSPQYETRKENPDARKAFIISISRLPFVGCVRAIQRYMDRMLIDKPPTNSQKTDTKNDTSFAATMVHVIAKEYGWTDDVILDLPMPRLFQYLRRIRRSGDPDYGFWNPLRDQFRKRVTDKYLNRNKWPRKLILKTR